MTNFIYSNTYDTFFKINSKLILYNNKNNNFIIINKNNNNNNNNLLINIYHKQNI